MADKNLNNLENLTDEQLEAVAGGMILDLGEDTPYRYRYAVIDDKTGKTLIFSDDLDHADTMADARDVSSKVITLKEYESIFGKKPDGIPYL